MHLSDYEEAMPEHVICKLPGEVYGEGKNSKQPYKPSRFDFEKLKQDLKKFKSKGNDEIVRYQNWTIVKPTVLIVEGLYALYDKELRDMASMRIFMDLDGDVRLGRWSKFNRLEKAQADRDSFARRR